MVNIAVRKNDRCVIDLPACDYVFSSTRSCFIAYGFQTSGLEKDILRSALEKRGIEPIEAGGQIAPGKYAFCTKICSKIITAQFCIVLLNNDSVSVDGKELERPNANVNLEYGLMLGHNKYVIPFQRDDQTLPFNVSGLDTMKYNSKNFSDLANRAIDQAIAETSQPTLGPAPLDQVLTLYLLARKKIVVSIDNIGEKNLYGLGAVFGFNLLTSFDGMQYTYMGNFTALRSEVIIWRIKGLYDVLESRFSSMKDRIRLGVADQKMVPIFQHFTDNLTIWVVVTGAQQKAAVSDWLKSTKSFSPTEIISIEEAEQVVNQLS